MQDIFDNNNFENIGNWWDCRYFFEWKQWDLFSNLDFNNNFEKILKIVLLNKKYAQKTFLKNIENANLNKENIDILNNTFCQFTKIYLDWLETGQKEENLDYLNFMDDLWIDEIYDYIIILLKTWKINEENYLNLFKNMIIKNQDFDLIFLNYLNNVFENIKVWQTMIDWLFYFSLENFINWKSEFGEILCFFIVNTNISDSTIKLFLNRISDFLWYKVQNIYEFILYYFNYKMSGLESFFYKTYKENFKKDKSSLFDREKDLIEKKISCLEFIIPKSISNEELKNNFEYQRFRIQKLKIDFSKHFFYNKNVVESIWDSECLDNNYINSYFEEILKKYIQLWEKFKKIQKNWFWTELELADIYNSIANLNLDLWKKLNESNYAYDAISLYEKYYKENPVNKHILNAVYLYKKLWFPGLWLDLLEKTQKQFVEDYKLLYSTMAKLASSMKEENSARKYRKLAM